VLTSYAQKLPQTIPNKNNNVNNMITIILYRNMIIQCIILLTIPTMVVVQATENHYCGTNWMAAATSCSNPCPSTLDTDCTTPGETCFGYTGCVKPRPPPTQSPTVAPIVITSKPTQKPKRTKKPTVSPTKFISLAPTTTISPTVTPPTISPVGSPSSSPIPRPLLIDLSNNGGLSIDDVQENRDDLQLSYGIIFDLQTTKNSGVIQVQSLEFYIIPNLDELKSQAMNNNSTNSTTASEIDNNRENEEEYKIQYEIYTKVGTWHGFEGRERSFSKVSSGNITVLPSPSDNSNARGLKEKRRRLQGGFATGFGVVSSSTSTTGEEELTISSKGGLIRISPTQFTPININGDETRQSIYITLSSRSLLYSRSSTSSTSQIQSITSISQITLANPNESKGDTIPLISEEELTIYTGASIMIYPYNKANQRIYYKKPREFVGRLWYHRKPCLDIEEESMEENIFKESSLEEIEVDIGIEDEENNRGRRERELGNVINWKNCIENTDDVELPPLEDMPFFFLSSSTSTSSGQTNIALPNNNNGTSPTTVPTTSSKPTITTSKVNLIITLHNVQASTIDLATGKEVYRTLNTPEQDEFEKITLELYDEKEILDMNEIELYGCNVFYQQILEPPSLVSYGIDIEEDEGGSGSRKSNRLRRNLQPSPDISIAESYEGRGNTSRPEEEFNLPLNTTTFVDPNNSTFDEATPQFIDPNVVVPTEPPIAPPPTPPPTEEFIPTSTSLEVTLVISILYTTLPQQITSELLSTILLQNKDEYMKLLKENTILSNYFNTLDEIPSVITVDTITEPPTLQPSNVPTVYVMTNSDVIKEPLSTSMTIGIIIALLYAVLACCSMLYVKRARRLMRIERSKRMIANSGVGGAGGSATAFIGHDMIYEEERKDTNVSKRRSSIRRGSSFMKSIVGGAGRRRSSKLSIDSDEMIGLNSSGVPLTESDSHDDDDNDEERYEEESEAGVSSMAESEYSEEEEEEEVESSSESSEEEPSPPPRRRHRRRTRR